MNTTYRKLKPMTRIKYCGLKTEQDVLAAAESQVWAVGFVFVKQSKRYIEPQHAVALTALAKSRGLLTVALFADQHVEEVRGIQQLIKPDVLQFHGRETVAYCEQFGQSYWKAIPMLETADWQRYAQRYASADAWLLDAFGKQQSGGSGRPFEWFVIPEQLRDKVILAGGIDAGNVAEAMAQTGSQFIDTSSGIESTPGVKSKEKMLAMAARVRNADREPVE